MNGLIILQGPESRSCEGPAQALAGNRRFGGW